MSIVWRTVSGIARSLGIAGLLAWVKNIIGLIKEETTGAGMDFSWVTSRIATGAGLNDAADVDVLVRAGVTAIIDCRDDFNDGQLLASTPGVLYLWNPTADDGQRKGSDWFGRSLEFALPILAQPRTKTYIHCSAGINRGPSTAYAIMVALSWPPPDAEHLIRSARPIVGLAYAGDAVAACRELGYIN